MKIYLITIVCIQSLNLFISFIRLSVCEWPRKREPETAGAEMAGALICMGFLIWAIILLNP